jgi:uncharacterized protein YjiS (DUF1127 family)
MVFEDARPYVAHAFGDAALQFVWLSLKHAAGRVVQNCVHAFAEGWREERMRRELFTLSDHLLKDIGLSRSEIGKLPGCLRSRPAELWPTDVATLTQESGELVAERGFQGLKLWLERECLADDLAEIQEIPKSGGASGPSTRSKELNHQPKLPTRGESSSGPCGRVTYRIGANRPRPLGGRRTVLDHSSLRRA